MIPITPKPKPPSFDRLVARPGKQFLAKTPHPTQQQWREHAYWVKVLDDLAEAYERICAYSCQRIERTTGSRNVDHFKPKDDYPEEAYVWDNYRLVCSRLNSRKGKKKILDPFTLAAGTFALQFPSLQVVPGPLCNGNPELEQQAEDTCTTLKLNEETTCIKSRHELVMAYCDSEINFPYLTSQNPFLAQEMERQGLQALKEIQRVMSYLAQQHARHRRGRQVPR